MDTINERTGLLGSNNGHANGGSGNHTMIYELLLNKTYTPGEESDNKLVRWPAQTLTLTKATLYSNYVNILLVFVPLGIIAGALDMNATAVFVLNFFAIIPLAALLSFATEEISVKLGETMGGLLNATFGNAVELIVRAEKRTHGEDRYWEADLNPLGQHCGSQEWRDPNCPI